MKQKIFSLMMVLVLSLGTVALPTSAMGQGAVCTKFTISGQVVNFPDPNLETAIREAIGKPAGDIYQSDLNGLTYLGAGDRSIVNLSGLEHCISLTDLYLDDNQINDIKPLVDNTGLAEGDTVYLGGNPLSSVSLNTYIPQLEARGVTVYYDAPQIILSVYICKTGWDAGTISDVAVILEDDNGDPINGLGKIEYRIDSDPWEEKSVNLYAPGAYVFTIQFPSEPGEHTLFVRADLGGKTFTDSDTFFVNYASQKIPVVLVHDYAKDPNSLSVLKGRLENDGFEVYVIDYSPGEPNCDAMGDIKGYAGNLSKEIEDVKSETGADKVDIVGHGMGGLVARWYVEKLNGNTSVRALILLGTPNHGSELFNPTLLPPGLNIPQIGKLAVILIKNLLKDVVGVVKECSEPVVLEICVPSLGEASEQMSPPCSPFLGLLNYNDPKTCCGWYFDILAPDVHYVTIAGTKCSILLTPTIFLFDYNDGFVSVTSARLSGISGENHTEFEIRHMELVTDEGVYAKISEILVADEQIYAKISETLHDAPVLANETYESELNQPQGLPTIYDTIENITKSYNATLSFANTTAFLLVWDNGDLNLTLTTPNGTMVNSTTAIDGMNITYYPSDNTTIEGYEIENPMNGSWMANVIPINASNTNYTLMTFLSTNLTILISPDKYNSYLGEQINLSANLTYINTSITNASVKADIARPDGEVDNMTLEVINQSYSGVYNNTNITGQYAIIATANGTLDGKEFIRQTAISIWVEQPPDLTVENISISNATPSIGDNVTITAWIENIGRGNATNATIEFYLDNPANGTLMGEGIIDVEANSTETISGFWVAEYGTHNIYVVIPASNPFLEGNYTNNVAFDNITVMGPVINVTSTMPVEVELYSTFAVEVLVENTGSEELLNANASITLPYGLSTADPLTANLGNISVLCNETALWNITTNQTGLYEIMVNLTSANAPSMYISKNISVTDIKITDLQTAPIYYPGDEVTIKTNITNLNPGVSYIGLYINTSITGPTNTSYSQSNISLLCAATTELSEIPFDETETCGLYNVNVSLFTSATLIDSEETTFEVITRNLTVDVAPPGTGNVSINGVTPSSYPNSTTWVKDAVVNLTATPDAANYTFVNWTGNVSTIADVNSASTYITMDGGYSITANFVETYNITISSTSGGLATTPGEGDFGPYANGTVIDLVATANNGYHFVEWTGDVDTIDDVDSASTNITMNGDYSIIANFALNQYTLIVSSTDGGNVTAPGEGIYGPYAHGVMIGLQAKSDTGYRFVNWTGDVDMLADVNSTSTYITMLGNYSIVANFVIKTATIEGTIWQANTSLLPDANVVLKLSGGEVANTTSNATGYYNFTVNTTGDYTINVTKGGFTYQEKWVNVTALMESYTCDFKGMDAPFPTAPDGLYVIKCCNLWLYGHLYPPGFALDATRVSDVVYAWVNS